MAVEKTYTQAGGAAAVESVTEEGNGSIFALAVLAERLNRRGHVVVLC